MKKVFMPVAVALLSACGGGGGESVPSSQVTSINTRAALIALLNSEQVVSLKGMGTDGAQYDVLFRLKSTSPFLFKTSANLNPVSLNSVDISSSTTRNSVFSGTDVVSVGFTSDAVIKLLKRGDMCLVGDAMAGFVDNTLQPPLSAALNEAQVIFSAYPRSYENGVCTGVRYLYGQAHSLAWLFANTDNFPSICLIYKFYDGGPSASSIVSRTQTMCFEVDTESKLKSRVSLKSEAPNFSVTVRNY